MKDEKKEYEISDFEVHETTIPIKVEYITCRECSSMLVPRDIHSIEERTSYTVIPENTNELKENITINYILLKGGYYECIKCKKIHNINNIECMIKYPFIYGNPRKENIYFDFIKDDDDAELTFLIFIWDNIKSKMKNVS